MGRVPSLTSGNVALHITTYGKRSALHTIAMAMAFAPLAGAHLAYVKHTVLHT
ncbi:MAG: hypothetical protein LKI98_04820 [Bifidobacterium crudilactis]|nr:hypothetical protein [Bifidobacterium crudilactis]